MNNGQSCICAKRFIVHTDVYDDFEAAFVEAMATLDGGRSHGPRHRGGPARTGEWARRHGRVRR